MLSLPQLWNQLFLQGTMDPFIEEWHLETKPCVLGCSLPLDRCSQALSADPRRNYVSRYYYMYPYISIHTDRSETKYCEPFFLIPLLQSHIPGVFLPPPSVFVTPFSNSEELASLILNKCAHLPQPRVHTQHFMIVTRHPCEKANLLTRLEYAFRCEAKVTHDEMHR